MKHGEVIFLILVSAFVVGVCIHGWVFEGYSLTVMLLPACIGSVLLVLACVRTLRTVRLSPASPETVLMHEYWKELVASFRNLLWCLLLPPLLIATGYPLGLSVFAAAYVRGHGGTWFAGLLFGGLMFALVWLLGVEILALPFAILPEWWR